MLGRLGLGSLQELGVGGWGCLTAYEHTSCIALKVAPPRQVGACAGGWVGWAGWGGVGGGGVGWGGGVVGWGGMGWFCSL